MFFPAKVLRSLLCATAVLLVVAPCVQCFASHEAGGKEGRKEAKESKKETKDTKKEGKEPVAHEILEAGPDETRGIELGEFRIRSDYPAEAQKCTVHFTLYLSVKGDHFAATSKLVEEHRQKLRDEVITATRLTPLAKFEEPDLKTFRRRILMRLQRTLPELAAEQLYVSNFNLLVKSL